jgi:hypothetical protein
MFSRTRRFPQFKRDACNRRPEMPTLSLPHSDNEGVATLLILALMGWQ